MLYLGYVVLGVNSLSWHGEIEKNDLILYSQMMVELWMKKRDDRRRENYSVKLKLRSILYASQSTISDTAGKYTDIRNCIPNQTSHTPDFPHPLTFSILVSFSSFLSVSHPQGHHYLRI